MKFIWFDDIPYVFNELSMWLHANSMNRCIALVIVIDVSLRVNDFVEFLIDFHRFSNERP